MVSVVGMARIVSAIGSDHSKISVWALLMGGADLDTLDWMGGLNCIWCDGNV